MAGGNHCHPLGAYMFGQFGFVPEPPGVDGVDGVVDGEALVDGDALFDGLVSGAGLADGDVAA
jgi:hypothetical protein